MDLILWLQTGSSRQSYCLVMQPLFLTTWVSKSQILPRHQPLPSMKPTHRAMCIEKHSPILSPSWVIGIFVWTWFVVCSKYSMGVSTGDTEGAGDQSVDRQSHNNIPTSIEANLTHRPRSRVNPAWCLHGGWHNNYCCALQWISYHKKWYWRCRWRCNMMSLWLCC